MKIVVIGGTGLIGSKLVAILRGQGHEVMAASPDSGVNTITGQGLAEALKGAAVMNFFQTSTRNLLAAEATAGVRHHVALSIVGSERMPDSGYMRAKVAQERLIKDSSVPYSIVHSTQFFEFVKSIAAAATDGNRVRIAPVLFQPIASDDVAIAVSRIAVGAPVNGTVEIGGPERLRFDEFIRRGLAAQNDPREVAADPRARYFGAELTERSLVPDEGAQLGKIRFEDWLRQPMPQR